MTVATTEPVVYTHTVQPTRRVLRKKTSASAFKGVDGRWHTYLNVEFPTAGNGKPIAHPDKSVCIRCNHGYAELMINKQDLCNECKLESIAEIAWYWQEMLNINLGWRRPHEYTQSEIVQQTGHRDKRISHINHRWRRDRCT